METFLGRGRPGWAGRPRRVGDRGRGEQTARGAQPGRYEHRGAESGGERVGLQVGRAGDARQGRQHGDREQAAEPGHIVVDRRCDPRALGGAEFIAVEVSGAVVIASPSPRTTTAGST